MSIGWKYTAPTVSGPASLSCSSAVPDGPTGTSSKPAPELEVSFLSLD